MSLINEDRMTQRLNRWSGGRVTVLAAACLGIGLALGILFF